MHAATVGSSRAYRIVDAFAEDSVAGRNEFSAILKQVISYADMDESGIVMETPCKNIVSEATKMGFELAEEFDYFGTTLYVLYKKPLN